MRILEFETTEKVHESERSVIYRTRTLAGDQKLVLKVFKADPPSSLRLSRIREELELARGLESPHVITIHRVESFGGTLVGVLEDFGAESLHARLARARLPLREALEVAIGICRGLADIHNAGIVHKNLCPANVLWNETSRVAKLIDFGCATRLVRAQAEPRAPRVLEGTLAFMSPEQTGRMNRPVDYRSDLYSLGATLYELFTGKRCFEGDDPLEIIHGHIAKQPLAPARHERELPEAISGIILKLLQKNAEDRYQSAEGVADDLLECVRQLDARALISPFALARNDVHSRFRLPAKLYGREQDAAMLVRAFQRVVAGELVFTLVTGHSGVGKSSLVQELYRPLAVARGRYVSGKYDQYQRSVPYSALARALDGLCDQLLGEEPHILEDWRQRILAAVGRNGEALIEVIPRLQEIIGQQPALPARDAQSAQNLFNQVCQEFVQAICRPGEPLVLFLDDLQWADIASLALLRSVLKSSRIRGLHLVGAYRDNEVDSSHPLLLLLHEADKAGIGAAPIHLDNLTLANVTTLSADTLSLGESEAASLAGIVHAKTQGNAFFTTEFLKALNAEGLLSFNRALRRWQWDAAAIGARQITDNVVELMADRIRLLPEPTQRLLRLGACIGGSFDLRTLAIISDGIEQVPQVLAGLLPAVQLGVIVPLDELRHRSGQADGEVGAARFKFQHDRVQQAAYSLIPELDRQRVHLDIARQLLDETKDSAELDERLFEIVSHLKKGATLLTDSVERSIAARLNLQAGLKARRASAYHAALDHFRTARELLPTTAFDVDYALAFEVHLGLAKSCSIAGQFEEADALYPILLRSAKTRMDQVRIHTVQMDDYHLQGAYERAISVQQETLALLGETVPANDADLIAAIERQLEMSPRYLRGRAIAELAQAPEIIAEEVLATLKTLMSLWISAYLVSNEGLVQWSSVRLANLSLEHGNSEIAAFGYVQYAYLCSARLQRFEEGYEYGQVALTLADRYDNLEMRGKIYFLFGLCINHWTMHVSLSTEAMRKGYLYSVEAGDWTYAVYGAANIVSNLIIAGVHCDEVETEAKKYLRFLKDKAEVGLNSFFLPGGYCALLNLQGKTRADDSFDCEHLDETTFHAELGHLPIVEAWFYAVKIRSLYLHRCFEAGVRVIAKAEVVAEGVPAQVKVPEAYFYSCLMLAATEHLEVDATTRAEHWRLFARYEAQLQTWAEHCPANYQHKYCLVVAERSRLQGASLDEVLGWYDQAIEAAQDSQFSNIVALARELKGRYWLTKQRPNYAMLELREAQHGYQQWGASRKVALLADEFQGLSVHADADAAYTPAQLDLLSAHKASRALSGKLELQDLIETMMNIVMENAGGDRGLLLRQRDGRWRVEAVAVFGETVEVRSGSGPESDAQPDARAAAPFSVVHYAARTQAPVVVDDPVRDQRFGQDSYIASAQPRAIFCIPLTYQGRTLAMLYLENKLSRDVFTADRRELVDVLTGQMAISLETANLYADLKATVAEQGTMVVALQRQQQELVQTNNELAEQRSQLSSQAAELRLLNAEVVRASHLKSEFLANMSHELRTPLNSIIGFAELLHDGEVGPVAPRQKEFLGDVLTSSKHLLALINDVLDLAKVEAGKLEFHPAPTDLTRVLAEVVSILRATSLDKQVHVTASVSPELGVVELDAARLKQVLYNYLSNALKFTAAGGRVTVRVVPEGPQALRIEVEDSGVGIAPANLQRLFQEFQQLDSGAAKKHGGTGLGLALTKRLVEAQGGSVGVRSVLGVGSCFHAVLPRRPVPGTKLHVARRAVSAGPSAPSVLVVEDDANDQAVIARALVEAGYSVDLVSTGAQALALSAERRFDAVTLDLILPDMSGLDVLERMRADVKHSDVPVVVLTVIAERATAGFRVHDVLPKPVDAAALLASLARAGVRPAASESTATLRSSAAQPAGGSHVR